jgi:hypothetical protein
MRLLACFDRFYPRYACRPRRFLSYAVTGVCYTCARTRTRGEVAGKRADADSLTCEATPRNRVRQETARPLGVTAPETLVTPPLPPEGKREDDQKRSARPRLRRSKGGLMSAHERRQWLPWHRKLIAVLHQGMTRLLGARPMRVAATVEDSTRCVPGRRAQLGSFRGKRTCGCETARKRVSQARFPLVHIQRFNPSIVFNRFCK